MNDNTAAYMTNPFASVSNQEAAELFWKDARAQTVPYGRGFMYLVRLNAQILAHSNGRRSVDNLVLEVLARQRAGNKVQPADWRAMVVHELGDAAGQEYDDMAAGKLITPPAAVWSSCLKPAQKQLRPFDLGFDEMSMAVVRGLRAGSQAAAAGLVDGDRIESIANLREARKMEDQEISLVISRGGQQRKLSYLPRGKPTFVWHWEQSAANTTRNCQF